jgi:hypothetical protein
VKAPRILPRKRLDTDKKSLVTVATVTRLPHIRIVPGGGRPAPQRRKEMFISFTLQVTKKWSLTVTLFF